jgi:hypothetical protein
MQAHRLPLKLGQSVRLLKHRIRDRGLADVAQRRRPPSGRHHVILKPERGRSRPNELERSPSGPVRERHLEIDRLAERDPHLIKLLAANPQGRHRLLIAQAAQ